MSLPHLRRYSSPNKIGGGKERHQREKKEKEQAKQKKSWTSVFFRIVAGSSELVCVRDEVINEKEAK